MAVTTHTTRTTQSVTFETVQSTETTNTESGVRPGVALLQVAGIALLALGAGVVAYLVPSLADPAQVAFNVANLAAVAMSYLHQRP